MLEEEYAPRRKLPPPLRPAPTPEPESGFALRPAAMADLCRRAGRIEAARGHYREAVALAQQAPERRYLMRRLAELGG